MTRPHRPTIEVCDDLESVMAHSNFTGFLRRKIADVVSGAVARTFNTTASGSSDGQTQYVAELGNGIAQLWKTLVTSPGELNIGQRALAFRRIRIPKGIIYLNSLGVRWDVLEKQSSQECMLRVPVYIGFTDAQRRREEVYNRKIFAPDSTHLLYLLCQAPTPFRVRAVLDPQTTNPRLCRIDRDCFPTAEIHLPTWKGNRPTYVHLEQGPNSACARSRAPRRAPFFRENADELHSLFTKWATWQQVNALHEILTKHDYGICARLEGNEVFLPFYNLYRLAGYADASSKVVGRHSSRVSELVYLPDVVLPSIAPAGFAGTIMVDNKSTDGDGYCRLLAIMQRLFSCHIGQLVAACEAETIQVSLEKGIRTKDTWEGMFTHHLDTDRKSHSTRIPLISSIREYPTYREHGNGRAFDKAMSAVMGIIQEHFIDTACGHSTRMLASGKLNKGEITPSIRNILRVPLFGYHALSREAFHTIRMLWDKLDIVDGQLKMELNGGNALHARGSCLLGLVNELLFAEQSLHYLQSYRDHFMHSFNVMLLGYWFLGLERCDADGKTIYAVFPDMSEEERIRLLKRWTFAAPVHDIAYPLEKLDAGAKNMFERFTKGGARTLRTIGAQAEWWKSLLEPAMYEFLHYTLAEASGEEGRAPEPKSPIFVQQKHGEGENDPIQSSFLAARLLGQLSSKQDHGVWGALLLRNHLFARSSKSGGPLVRNAEYLSNDADAPTAVCTAVAVHHIGDLWQKAVTSGAERRLVPDCPEWRLVPCNHRLAALLLLCDALCQWGRTRALGDGLSGLEEQRHALLGDLRYGAEDNCVRMDIVYPRCDVRDIGDIKPFWTKPLDILGDMGGMVVEVRLNGKSKKGARARVVRKCLK